ncbi:MAG TPA: hypothetical protein VHB98_06305 [Chloroflexota bacterium]|nr:hypothetical protein [Chloroflexota bacterium]
MILRALFPYPLRDLPHYDRPGMPGVQPEVHRQMLGYLRSGVYRERTARPNGVDLARLYAPAGRRRTARVVTTTVQYAGSGAGPAGGPLPARAWVVSGGSSPAQTRS